MQWCESISSKSSQKADFKYKITVIPLYQNDGYSLAESVRFELTVGRPITSFQDWLLKPLGQLSIGSMIPFCTPKVKCGPFGNLLTKYVFALDKPPPPC